MTRAALAIPALLAAFALATPGLADDVTVEHHDRTDINDDGEVDRGEYYYRLVEIFYLSDDNKDGFLVIEEIGRVEPAEFDKADKNDDGKLSMDEYTEARNPEFDELDTNDDGVVSVQEAREHQP